MTRMMIDPGHLATMTTKKMSPTSRTIHGIDGCPAGWLVVTLAKNATIPAARIFPTLKVFAETLGKADIVAIDMPMGLPDAVHPHRTCDVAVRKLLGRRHVCVFSPPCRSALNSANREAASAINRSEVGRKLSAQSWGIVPKIKELDDWLQANAEYVEDFHEVHPEVSFAHWRKMPDELADPEPFFTSKKRFAGKTDRQQLIETVWPGALAAATTALGQKARAWASDDLHDAFACLWTAHRLGRAEARCFPSGNSVLNDTKGLRMAIYA